jgi:hypothetical protein
MGDSAGWNCRLSEGVLMMAFELAEGGDLKRFLVKREAPLSQPLQLRVGSQVSGPERQ